MTLDSIVGQELAVNRLRTWLIEPRPACFLLEGPPGIGKTASAFAVAEALGADDLTGLYVLPASELNVDAARELFTRTLRLRAMSKTGWKVLLLEELDGVASKQLERYLKVVLDEYDLPPRTLVLATSNDATAIPSALRQRFQLLHYSTGPDFARACQLELARLWHKARGEEPMPRDWLSWGKSEDGYSMRLAKRSLNESLTRPLALVA